MKRVLPVLLISAVLGGCVVAPPVAVVPVAVAAAPAQAPQTLLNFYKDADAYRVSSERRVCADRSVAPRLEALQRRFAAATQMLVERYGKDQVDASRVAVVTSGSDLCTNRAALAASLASFEAAVSDFEAALK